MIHNGPKRTIFVSGGLGLLQMVPEPDTGRCASKDDSPQREWSVQISRRFKREETFFYNNVETSLDRCVLKP